MVRPTTWRSRPLRTVSTSGSSGTGNVRSVVGGGGGAVAAAHGRGAAAGLVGYGTGLRSGRVTVADRGPGGLGSLLLGLFLRVPFARPVAAPAHPDRGTEEFLVIRPALLDVVLGHAEESGGGEFLERRFPVEARAEPGRAGDHRVEEPVHQLSRLVQAALKVDRADHGLQRVGQDRGLVPAAGALLAPAEAYIRSQLEPACYASQGSHVDHGRPQLGQ